MVYFCIHGIFLQSCELSRQQNRSLMPMPSLFRGLAQPRAPSPPSYPIPKPR